MHGGTTPSGFGLPQTKTGKYSKVLPIRLQQRYEASRESPVLLSLRDDIAACESRLADLFQRVDSGESGHLWHSLRGIADAFSAAMTQGDVQAMHRHFARLRDLIGQGSADYAAWAEIQALWETRCKLTLTEQKTLVAMQQMVTTEQLMVYFGVITDAIRRSVLAHADPDSARTILAELSTEFHRVSVLEARQ